MKNLTLTLSSFLVVLIFSCKPFEATTYDYPRPVDTSTRPIQMQEKKVYEIKEDGVYADNQFDGARMNNFTKVGENKYQILIEPENVPINMSPYYAFRIWSDEVKTIELELDYAEGSGGKHRYWPKYSHDGENWIDVDSFLFKMAPDSINASFWVETTSEKLWIAAQEIRNSGHVKAWCEKQAEKPNVNFSVVGKSKLGRDMLHLDLLQGESMKKPTIVFLSRQHPPELTGYFAMEAYVETVLDDNPLSNAFREKYRIMIFPLMNPDGVDLGHWRHNAGGIDLNRDWAYYNQEEPRVMANHVAKTVKENKSEVVLGIDFHSTYYDVYYTRTPESQGIPGFKDYWIYGIGEALKDYEPNDQSSPLGQPIAASWFVTQFGGEGITYEVGDTTDRDFIRKKAKQAAIQMMSLLIFKE